MARTRPTALGLVAVGALLLAVAGPAAAADPPGNNGTVKISNKAFDEIPNNEPHQGCSFYVQFYGYDEGQLYATATFAVLLPSGEERVVLEGNNVYIGQDPASGAGTTTGFDAARNYDLNEELAGYVDQSNPNQGVHVKLTVVADGSIGSDTKYKTFWAQGCQGTGSIELRKRFTGTYPAGLVDLFIKQGATTIDSEGNAGDGGTTGANTVPTGSYQVSETGTPGTDLTEYAASLSCFNDNGAGAGDPDDGIKHADEPTVSSTDGNVTVAQGDDIVCTFTNQRDSDA